MRFCLIVFIFLLSVASHSIAASFNVGFRTIGYTNSLEGLRLDINLWYPSKRIARSLRFPPWEIRGALSSSALSGPFPLILLSHPSSGNRFSYHDTAYALAQEGFIVAAPTHPLDNMDNMPLLYSWEQMSKRAEDLSLLIKILKEDEIGIPFDPNKIAILGYGIGASAALLLAGAELDCTNWPQYCSTEQDNLYCNTWAKTRIQQKICAALPIKKTIRDKRIQAMALISPHFPMLFTKKSLFRCRIPTFIAIPDLDIETPASSQRTLARAFSHEPRIYSIQEVDAVTLLAPCPESLAMELPELCRPHSSEAHKRATESLVLELTQFFHEQLGTSHLLQPNIVADKKKHEQEPRVEHKPLETEVRPLLPPRQARMSPPEEGFL